MNLDYRAIGKAAVDQAINLAGSDWTEEQMHEAIGRAAVAKMIPAAEPCGTFDHRHCAFGCPFLRAGDDASPCAIGLGDWGCGVVCPGPSCPASMEGK